MDNGYRGLPKASPVLEANPAEPISPALRRVLAVLCANLGLSVVLTCLMFFFRDSVIDYQLAHLSMPPGADLDVTRSVLRQQVWGRVAGVVVASVMYLRIGYRLRRGHRGAYRRILWISCAGLAALGWLFATGEYPVWVRIEQALQGVVLATLLWSVTRPELRAKFAK
jgi:hypothetical protein